MAPGEGVGEYGGVGSCQGEGGEGELLQLGVREDPEEEGLQLGKVEEEA